MYDIDTFLTTLYVMADAFCEQHEPLSTQSGHKASLEPGEVVSRAILQQHWRFLSERNFYRFAQNKLMAAFPDLPNRSQFNHLARQHWKTWSGSGNS